jgi:hypothetical protein
MSIGLKDPVKGGLKFCGGLSSMTYTSMLKIPPEFNE